MSGYRFSLIYNLAIANRKEQPQLSLQDKITSEIDTYLQKWSRKENDQFILAYLLDHSYSEQNLSLKNLKNKDFAKASILLKSAEKNACKAFLCLVSYKEESYGDCQGYESERNYEEYEITKQEVYAHHFINSQGDVIPIENLTLFEDDEVLSKIPLREGPGREVSISEATGNEGATKELWYHRGAIILWPEHKDFDMILKADIAYATHHYKNLIQNHDIANKEVRRQALTLAPLIIEKTSSYSLDTLTEDFITLGDIQVLKKHLTKLASHGLSKLDVKTLIRILDQFSWEAFADDLTTVLDKTKFYNQGILPWIQKLLLEKPSKEGYPIITKWFEKTFSSSKNLSHSFHILCLLDNLDLTDKILSSLDRTPLFLSSTYAPTLIQVIETIKKDSPILKKLADDFITQAKLLYPTAPILPKDLFRQGELACSCEFCKEVNIFLPDPLKETIHFGKTLKGNLLHIEDKIREKNIDLSISIERQPPKFGATIAKNQNSYEELLRCFTIISQAKQKAEKVKS